jgi:adenine-specific DNA methylase
MHKYFARRPWNVFSELVSHYSSPEEIVLDPFCGGGVTVVESLKMKRKAVGVDLNPMATYVTLMETKPLDLDIFLREVKELAKKAKPRIERLYSTKCPNCGRKGNADWIEWDEQQGKIIRLKCVCAKCGVSREKHPDKSDVKLANEVGRRFEAAVTKGHLWFPPNRIPVGDKTISLLNKGTVFFHQLFTRRNLLALAILLAEIENLRDSEAKDFLRFVFSSSLKWASRQSHLRGQIVEGWAMHAYWIYPKSLEINVWNTFERRITAFIRGKKYSNECIGDYCKLATNFRELTDVNASCLILNQSASRLPIPDASVDVAITDPPYGGNVNYGELSDFWYIWISKGKMVQKEEEVIINRSQRKGLEEYEELLYGVFKECYRVLKPHGNLVSTFNSKNLRVVSSFVTAASRAGFTLHPESLLFQKPIRSYKTTFHAMQIGAFVGDYIFTFVKEQPPLTEATNAEPEFAKLQKELNTLIAKTERGSMTEPQLRERAYGILIPFLAKYARNQINACKVAADFFELKMGKLDSHFMNLRMRITEKRRRKFSRQSLGS